MDTGIIHKMEKHLEKKYYHYISLIGKALGELKNQTQGEYTYDIRVSKKIMQVFIDETKWVKDTKYRSGTNTLFGETISVEKSYTDDMISIQPVLFSIRRKEDYENRIEHVFFL